MAFLTPEEITTHLYGEVTTEINRGDATKLQSAIDAATAQAKGYLTQYDVAAIFAATSTDRNAIILLFVKDIAVWHYIQLANPGVEMELRMKRYDDAIHELREIQRGNFNPDLPMKAAPVDPVTGSTENMLKWGGNPRRGNYQN